MEVLKRKIWKLPLIVWLMIMMFIGLATGAIMYTLTIPGTITIEPAPEGVYEIKVYSDAAGTQELTSIDFGTARAGDYIPFSFYVKNTGTVTVSVNLKATINDVTAMGFNDIITDFEPGQIRYIDQNLHIRSTTGAGTYSVEIKLEVYA